MSIGIVLEATTTSAVIAIYNPEMCFGAYLELKHPRSPVLAQITDLKRTEKSEIAFADLLGHSDGKGGYWPVESPPDIKADIAMAQPTLIRDVLGVQARSRTGLYIGRLYKNNLKVYLDYLPLMSTHCAVLAKSGMGKSYSVGVIIEEMLKRGISIVVIDPHGEYLTINFSNDNVNDNKKMKVFNVTAHGYCDQFHEYSPDTEVNKTAMPLRFDIANLDRDDILTLTSIGISEAQTAILDRSMFFSRQQNNGIVDLNWIIDYIENKEKSPARFRVIAELWRLKQMQLFEKPATTLAEIVSNGITVINLKGVEEDIQQVVCSRIAKRLFEAIKVGEVEPCMLIVEEAHIFAPELGEIVSKGPLKRIAFEGRKFGLGLLVVSQSTAQVTKRILSQCGTFIIHRLTNPNDVDAVMATLEGSTANMMEAVKGLPVGIAMISSISLPHPITVEVRPRESKHGGIQKVG